MIKLKMLMRTLYPNQPIEIYIMGSGEVLQIYNETLHGELDVRTLEICRYNGNGHYIDKLKIIVSK